MEALPQRTRFPQNAERRAAWVRAVRRANWKPTKFSRICSEHFSEDQIDRTSLCCVRLRDYAVPNIFKAFPPYLQKLIKNPQKPPTESFIEYKNKEEPVLSEMQTNATSAEPSPCKQELKRKLHEVKELNCVNRKKIKLLQQTIRRQKKTIFNLKTLLKDLQKSRIINDDYLDNFQKSISVNEEILSLELTNCQKRPVIKLLS
ncbi:THAP domain-containing protein 1-like isoform X2 [Stegodyphus dumicola]|uniref:THAP domain-containing protein 1-like isoform X2 n=1 Tax=Stegodyphus dumicola TaxID=202533 RepID=UPI0015B19360|nr:THAP domain-containing protein 1-like isoform X2 [Stegodyphus dumicola]